MRHIRDIIREAIVQEREEEHDKRIETERYRRVVRTTRRAAECGGTDAELVERAVRNAVARKTKVGPAWAAVKRAFGVGSTSAHNLCRRFNIDPDTGRAIE